MLITLFRAVFSSALRMALPLGLVLLLVPVLRKRVRPRTLAAIQKLMMVGMLLALILTLLGPLVRVPVSYRLVTPQASPALPASAPMEQPTVSPGTVAGDPVPSGTVRIPSLWEIAGAVWLCGTAARLALTFIQNARFLRRIRRDSFPATDELSQLEMFCSLYVDLRAEPAVRIAPAVSSPMAAGCFRPVIYLPARALLLPQEEQRLLLIHELYHCKAKDNLWRVFSSVLLAVYWFDPLIWALAGSFSTQCELCCDENVLSGVPVRTRKLYGGLLLSFATVQKPSLPQPVPSLQSGWKESFRDFKLRIEQIVSQERKVAGKMVLAGCCAIFVLFSGMVGRETFTPSKVIILPDNPYGDGWGIRDYDVGLPTPRRTFSIPFPLPTERVYHTTFYNEDGSIYTRKLYFFANTEHEPVTAGCDGVVAAVQTKKRPELETEDGIPVLLGKYVIIDCGDGISLRYTYLDEILVEEGQWVRAGDIIGTAGNTGGSYGYYDQCGVHVMQDGLMLDPLLFFDVLPKPTHYPLFVRDGVGYSWMEGEWP